MATYSRLAVLDGIIQSGLVPIFHHQDVSVAKQIMNACVAGGARVIEFTNRGDGAWQLFTSLLLHRQKSQADVMLGAGSIIDVATAGLYVNNGADFIVGPTFDRDIAELCNRRKVAYIPGCGTLTEISNAEAAGVELVKIFPGDVLGPNFIKAVHGPLPWTKMVVTGGVLPDEVSIKEWFEAGATAVGIGSKLIRRDWVKTEQFDRITETVSLVLGWIDQHKTRQHN